MDIYMAPMEGPTGYVFRNTYNKHFGGADKYFTPFVTGLHLGDKQKRDVIPEHNSGMNVVPQILTNRVDEFLSVANFLHSEYGYEHININLGCPSGTVVARKRDAGFLSIPDELDAFLYECFEKTPIKISLKTRIGMEDESEWDRLFGIYDKYTPEELIIHPRLRTDYYKNEVHMKAFEMAYRESKNPLCYNGDINTASDYKNIVERYPNIRAVMIGRGILRNPFLIEEIKDQAAGGSQGLMNEEKRKRLKAFLRELEENYLESMPGGENNTLAKMKELWVYLGEGNEDYRKALKAIRKSKHMDEYHAAVRMVL